MTAECSDEQQPDAGKVGLKSARPGRLNPALSIVESWTGSKSANIGRGNAGKDVARIRRDVCFEVYRQAGRFRNPDLLTARVAAAFCANTVQGRADAIDGLIAHHAARNLSLPLVLLLLVDKDLRRQPRDAPFSGNQAIYFFPVVDLLHG